MLELLAQTKALNEQISVRLVRIAGLDARNGQPLPQALPCNAATTVRPSSVSDSPSLASRSTSPFIHERHGVTGDTKPLPFCPAAGNAK